MKVQEYAAGDTIRRVLTGMILDAAVIGRIAPVWQADLFEAPWARTAGNWAVNHFLQYGQPIGRDIEGTFTRWAETRPPDDVTIPLMESLLSSLSREYELAGEINSEHILDVASRHFDEVRFDRAVRDAQSLKAKGKLDEAYHALAASVRVPLGRESLTHLFTDESAMGAAFDDKHSQPLVTYPSALGEFYGLALERDGFIAFLAPEKRGKSFVLIDLAYRAMTQRRRTLFLGAGDMSESQYIRRFAARAAEHPFRSPGGKWPYRMPYPKKIRPGEVDHEDRVFDSPLGREGAVRAARRVQEKEVKSKNPYFAMQCFPNGTLTVDKIRSIVKDLDGDGWTVDCVVVDYADILALPSGRMEVRDQINRNWMALSALRAEFHCLLATATQATRESYDTTRLKMKHISDDKRKLSHATGVCGINSSEEEKELGLCRLNWIVLREGEFLPERCVWVAGCLPVANPAVLSCWGRIPKDKPAP